MSQLPPYDPDMACPKCGHDKVTTKHERRAEPFASLAMSLGQRLTTDEHLRRVCHRCGYGWAQAPLDHTTGDPR